jgi:1,4-dihydroxy-2-naphthoate octaprenyltransferase
MIWFWLKNSRIFSLPMALLSWLVIFVYAYKLGGNVLNGLVALVGISFAQLATNLFDDYMDYKNLPENCQQAKCAYLKSGNATLNDILKVVSIYLGISCVSGLFLFFRCGFPVIFLALIGGIFVLMYSKLSQKGLSELSVGVTFGPLLFEGVYFVMTKTFSLTVFVMSIAVVMFTIGLMYTHTVLDFEGDKCANKKTLVCRLNDKSKAINGVFVVYSVGYLFTVILSFLLKNTDILLTLVLIPLVFKLHKTLKTFTCGGEKSEFYFRLLQARNIMIYYSVILACCFYSSNL